MHRYLSRIIATALAAAGLCSATTAAESLDEQRAAFRGAYARAELGDRDALLESRELLASYVLWPDLEAAFLRAQLATADHALVRHFLEQHETLKPARELRYRFALHLGKARQFDEFRPLYDAHYRDLGVARLDCLDMQADIAAGRLDGLIERARGLWLVGHSQVGECDPVFAHLRKTRELDAKLYRERFDLAVAARSLSLARYLARSLPPKYRDQAARWTAAYGVPQRFIAGRDRSEDTDLYRRQLIAAIEMLAYDDPLAANEAWVDLAGDYRFDDAQRAQVERHLALWMARNHLDTADAALANLPDAAVDGEVLRWRVRRALVRGDWPLVLDRIERLPPAEQQTEQWRYWSAIALQHTGESAAAATLLERLAAERSYYGFLAADALGIDYAWSHQSLGADESGIARLAARPELIRARELFLVDLDGRGRSEWDAAVNRLAPDEQLQAAILAHRWGWHSRAIATAAGLARYDDLQIRYPLPYSEAFEQYAAAAGIRPSWAFGIARSESLFMRDVRSGAGALGVMQLMPGTARLTASELREPYRGRATLIDPTRNIRLGTWYLGKMYQRFDNNRVLATAAYNAGPLRVERWLPPSGDIDARIWVEIIPYQETRDYVRRVLAADTIFHWRMEGEMRRLSSELPDVTAPPAVADLAQR